MRRKTNWRWPSTEADEAEDLPMNSTSVDIPEPILVREWK
jgi:hypothetical protein